MIVRALDGNNDWTFGRGRNNYLSGKSAVGQLIATRLRSFLGDCFFATADGISWFNLLGAKDQLAIEVAVSTVIKNTPGVTKLTQLSVKLDLNRNLSIVYSVDTVFSQGNNQPNPVSGIVDFLLTQDDSVLTTEDGDKLVI